jgi:hypothetical protein
MAEQVSDDQVFARATFCLNFQFDNAQGAVPRAVALVPVSVEEVVGAEPQTTLAPVWSGVLSAAVGAVVGFLTSLLVGRRSTQ